MYLHIGENTVITTDKIIGIFDMDTSTVNKATRDYLSLAEKNIKLFTLAMSFRKALS
jgi:hypothetical protein